MENWKLEHGTWYSTYSGKRYTSFDSEGHLHSFDDEPAVYYPETKECLWYYHGNIHRTDGPAKIYADGSSAWYFNDCYAYGIPKWAKEMSIDLDNLTEDDKILIALKWANYKSVFV